MMFSAGLFSQIVASVIAIAIMITYVQPAFVKIGKVQDDIALYQVEREKIKSVNTKLAQLTRKLNNQVTPEDQKRLFTYMPDEVDEVAVQRDLILITKEAGISFASADYVGLDKTKNDDDDDETAVTIQRHKFTVAFEGTYEQIKKFLTLTEQNNYPLEVYDMSISQLDGGFLSTSIDFITYAHQPKVAPVVKGLSTSN